MPSETTIWERARQDKDGPKSCAELLAEFRLAAEISRTMGRPLITVDEMRDELDQSAVSSV